MECCHLGKILLLTLLIITFGYCRSILVNVLLVFVLCMRVASRDDPVITKQNDMYCFRFSRRVLWLKVGRTNKDPYVVAHHFMEFVEDISGNVFLPDISSNFMNM